MSTFLSQWFPVLICGLLGLGCMVMEVFLPGFGLPGIAGIVLEVAAIALSEFLIGGSAALYTALILLALTGLGIFFSVRSVRKGRLSKSDMVLQGEERPEDGYVAAENMEKYVGQEGITLTALRPTGTAEICGERLTVSTEGGFLAKDIPVRVLRAEGMNLFVAPVKD